MQVMYSNYNISGRVGPYSILPKAMFDFLGAMGFSFS